MGATGWGAESGPVATPRSPTVHERVRAAPEFVELRRRLRRFAFPTTVAFLLWYLAYVVLACYARGLMAVPVAEGINLGLVIGLLQFASTFVISTVYVVFARRRLDPLAERLRAEIERELVQQDAATDVADHDDTRTDPTAGHWFDDDPGPGLR